MKSQTRRHVRRSRVVDFTRSTIKHCERTTKLVAAKPACRILQALYNNGIFVSFIKDAVSREEHAFRDEIPTLTQLDIITLIAIKAVGSLKPFSVEIPLRRKLLGLIKRLDLIDSDYAMLGEWNLLLVDGGLNIHGIRDDGYMLLPDEEAAVAVSHGDYGECPEYTGYSY